MWLWPLGGWTAQKGLPWPYPHYPHLPCRTQEYSGLGQGQPSDRWASLSPGGAGGVTQPHRGIFCLACPFLPLCLVIAVASSSKGDHQKLATLLSPADRSYGQGPASLLHFLYSDTGLPPAFLLPVNSPPSHFRPGEVAGESPLKYQPCPGHRYRSADLRSWQWKDCNLSWEGGQGVGGS